MSDEDFGVKGPREIIAGEDLCLLSIEDLEERITLLEQEISRIRIDIAAKKLSKEAAESIFRS